MNKTEPTLAQLKSRDRSIALINPASKYNETGIWGLSCLVVEVQFEGDLYFEHSPIIKSSSFRFYDSNQF